MTASWGGVGVIWGKDVVTAYIRPQRYTKEFVDANDTFTISFFPEEYRKALSLCGSVSGRDRDKIAEAGLPPAFSRGLRLLRRPVWSLSAKSCIMETFSRKTLTSLKMMRNGTLKKIIIQCTSEKF